MQIDCEINLIFTSNIYWHQKTPIFFLLPFPPPFPYMFFLPALLLITPNIGSTLVLKVAGWAWRVAAFPSSHRPGGGKRERTGHRAVWLCKRQATHFLLLEDVYATAFFLASSGISMKILQKYNVMGKGGWLRKVVVVKSSKMKRSIWGKRRAPFQTQSNEHDFALFCRTTSLFSHHF